MQSAEGHDKGAGGLSVRRPAPSTDRFIQSYRPGMGQIVSPYGV